MWYVFTTTGSTAASPGVRQCHGSYSHEFAAYSKKSRLKKLMPFMEVDIVYKV